MPCQDITETRVTKSIFLITIAIAAIMLHIYKLDSLKSITTQNTVEPLQNYFVQVSNISAGKFRLTPYQNEKMNTVRN